MTHNADTLRRGTPLAESDRARLATLVARDGERAALTRIGCSKAALRSALAGMPIYRVTASAIRAALDRP